MLESAPVNYKDLYRKVERTLAKIGLSEDLEKTLSLILKSLVDDYKGELGISGGRIYRLRGKSYVLTVQYGHEGQVAPGFRVPLTYAPIKLLRRKGYLCMGPDDPGLDPEIESKLGVKQFAAIAVGEESPWIIAFNVADDVDREHLRVSLSTIRHAVNLKLRQEVLEDIIQQAKAIQMELLPKEVPVFAGFDLWGRSIPAEEVGGDLYDFIAISERMLGVAIADSSGHGLPAALQARDVITGLRVVIEESFKIVKGIEKLNRVISRGSLQSRFISLFYGEIEPNGNFLYTNAGHPPPIFVRDGRVKRLDKGGMILGPNPDAKYERGYIDFRRGSVLVMYSDGITEATRPNTEEMFGARRLARFVKKHAAASAREIGELIFEEADRWCGRAPLQDDRTVVVLRRP